MLSERRPRLLKQSVSQAIEFVLLRAHPFRLLEHEVLKAAHPSVVRQYLTDYSLLACARDLGVSQSFKNR